MLFHRFSVCLLVLFCLAGCQMEDEEYENTGFIPEGKWNSFDCYTITKTHIDYFMAGSEWDGVEYPDTVLKGSIEKAVDFSVDAGVLIIKIIEATYNTSGKFTGVYYKDYAGSSIKLAAAIGPEPDYAPVETDSLSEALSVFTVDNALTHVSFWGSGYTK